MDGWIDGLNLAGRPSLPIIITANLSSVSGQSMTSSAHSIKIKKGGIFVATLVLVVVAGASVIDKRKEETQWRGKPNARVWFAGPWP